MTDDGRSWQRSITNSIDRNIRWVNYVPYSLAFCGAALIVKHYSLLSRFNSIRQIPRHIIEKNWPQRAVVKEVDGAAIIVFHKPYLDPFPNASNGNPLTLKLSSLRVTESGKEWIAKVLPPRRNIYFRMHTVDENAATIESHVHLRHTYYFFGKDINKSLVKSGFASVRQTIEFPKSMKYQDYLEKMLKYESKASRKNVGLWADIADPTLFQRIKKWFRRKRADK